MSCPCGTRSTPRTLRRCCSTSSWDASRAGEPAESDVFSGRSSSSSGQSFQTRHPLKKGLLDSLRNTPWSILNSSFLLASASVSCCTTRVWFRSISRTCACSCALWSFNSDTPRLMLDMLLSTSSTCHPVAVAAFRITSVLW